MRQLPFSPPPDPRRRQLLHWLAAGPVALALGAHSRPAAAVSEPLRAGLLATRRLSMVSTHTGERADVSYFESGGYVPAALTRLHRVLRDHRSGEIAAIDPLLFDQLHALACIADCAPHYEIISGYRSPATNAKLRQASTGVATKSLHMEGRAIDVRLPGVPLSRLRDLAISLKAGGVGYYPKSDFVHLDTGRVRTWTG